MAKCLHQQILINPSTIHALVSSVAVTCANKFPMYIKHVRTHGVATYFFSPFTLLPFPPSGLTLQQQLATRPDHLVQPLGEHYVAIWALLYSVVMLQAAGIGTSGFITVAVVLYVDIVKGCFYREKKVENRA